MPPKISSLGGKGLNRKKLISTLVGLNLCPNHRNVNGGLPCVLLQTEDFAGLTDDERTAMKWKFLLERCKVYVKVGKSMSYVGNPSLHIL